MHKFRELTEKIAKSKEKGLVELLNRYKSELEVNQHKIYPIKAQTWNFFQ